jgi:hypothetical protein
VADDLLLLCKTGEEATSLHEELVQGLRVNALPTKGSRDTVIRNLANGHEAEWLGFQITKKGDDLIAHIGEKAWGKLARGLLTTHGKVDAPLRANDMIRAWFSQQGPCYKSTDIPATYQRVTNLASTYGFEEIPSWEEISDTWERAHIRYVQTSNTVGNDHVLGAGSATAH